MKDLALLAALLPAAAIGQCDGVRFREYVFPEFWVHSDIPFGRNADYNGDSLNLLLDVYEPAGDPEQARPLVIFAHGGFFITGSKEGEDVVPVCQDLARMGYVAASINYRLGFPLTDPLAGPLTAAVMRGVHDMKGAVRFFRRLAAEEDNPYRIDPEQIYVAGVSAGGYIALHLAYLDEEEELPGFLNLGEPGLAGGLAGASGSPGYSDEVGGIISVAGAIGDSAWIHPGDEPACLFHGDQDNIVPYGSGTQLLFGVIPVLDVDGSASVSQRLEENGVPHCFETYEGQDHVPSVGQEAYYDTTLSILTNFLSHLICGADLDCEYREIPVAVEEPMAGPAMPLPYPVPSRGILHLGTEDPAHLQIADLTGRTVAEATAATSISMEALPRGMYVLWADWPGKRACWRVARE